MKKNILTNTLINCDQKLYILNYIYFICNMLNILQQWCMIREVSIAIQ